jgi:hypothetical protein
MGVACGPADDGCGGTQDCGKCKEGVGVAGGCCVARSCSDPKLCGYSGTDGCGGYITCPKCSGGPD